MFLIAISGNLAATAIYKVIKNKSSVSMVTLALIFTGFSLLVLENYNKSKNKISYGK